MLSITNAAYASLLLEQMISKSQRLHSKFPVSAHSILSSLAPLIPWALPSPTYQTPLHATISFAALSHHSPHKTMSYSSALTDNILLTLQTSSHLCIPHLPYYTQKYRKLRSGRSEEHTSELQSLHCISYAVFCLSKMISKPQRLYSNPGSLPTQYCHHWLH